MVELLVLQFLPLLGALIVLLFPKNKKETAAILALVTALLELLFVFLLLPQKLTVYLGLGLGVTMVLSFDYLTAIVLIVLSFACAYSLLYSLRKPLEHERSPSFYSLILLVLFGTVGVALARDLIQFYVFWEAMLIPAWALVVNWNEDPKKVRYTGLKFFIITHIGAVLTLASILWIYSTLGTTNMFVLQDLLPKLPVSTLVWMAALFFMAFIVKLAIFPFHTWLPDAYTTSSMPVTLVLVGMMTSVGIYGFARFLPFFPREALLKLSLPFLIASLVNMFYGGAMALAEKNAKRMIAYSSMSQMGYVLFGFATLVPLGISGSVFNIMNQAVTKLVLFTSVALVAESASTWRLDELGGWAKRHPFAAVCASAAMLSLLGAPPVLGFWPEFLTFSGGFASSNYLVASLALVASVLTAAYGLRLVRFVFFGPLQKEHEGSVIRPPWNTSLALAAGLLIMIIFGIYPGPAFQLVRGALNLLGIQVGG
ncbi:MAG: NADH-quinone oxidoreductase subunit M [Coprothermobacterota bacterium]|nr:NADH-quinone oxidoreductase subunit M [Coprothermobacterota bacterium]